MARRMLMGEMSIVLSYSRFYVGIERLFAERMNTGSSGVEGLGCSLMTWLIALAKVQCNALHRL